jgi:hypothetical protein
MNFSSYLTENTVRFVYNAQLGEAVQRNNCCLLWQLNGVQKCGVWAERRIWGAFAGLRKDTLSFIMHVRMEQLVSHWTDFHEIWYLSILRKHVKKIQISLESDKNNGYFAWRPVYIYDNSLNSSQNEKGFRQSCREN